MEEQQKDEKKKKRFRFPCGCQSLGCLFLVIVVVICIFIAYIFVNKPNFIWNEVVNYLNNGLEPKTFNTSDEQYENVQDRINSEIETVGENEVIISEEELSVLAQNRFPELKDVGLDLEEEEMIFYWVIDEKIVDNPLYGVAILKINEKNELYIEQLGTKRVGLPRIVNRFLTRGAQRILNLGSTNQGDNLIFEIINSDSNYQIKEIKLLDDAVYLKVELKVNLID